MKVINKFIINFYNKLPLNGKKIIEKFLKKYTGGEYCSKLLRECYYYTYGNKIGIGTYGVFYQDKYKYVNFGNYCSIANGFEYFPRNHPKDYASMHPFFYNKSLGFVKESPIEFSFLDVGNDVWIGKNVLITSKCDYIGNGAIIGAGSVVTKSVEPYSIVAGNPARVIGKRFDDETCQLLESSKWFELNINELKDYLKYIDNPKLFSEKIIEEKTKNSN